MHAVKSVLKPKGELIILIKPQFEVERHQIARGGIVKNSDVRQKAVEKVIAGVELAGYVLKGVMQSPIQGADGNIEFLAYFIAH